jgi:hypothetical protein
MSENSVVVASTCLGFGGADCVGLAAEVGAVVAVAEVAGAGLGLGAAALGPHATANSTAAARAAIGLNIGSLPEHIIELRINIRSLLRTILDYRAADN